MNPRSNKRELSKRVAQRYSEESGKKISQTLVMRICTLLLEELRGALVQSGKVELREFGVFKSRRRAARVGRNPMKPDVDIEIPAYWDVSFKPSENWKRDLARWMTDFPVHVAINRTLRKPDHDGMDKRLP